MKKVISVLLAIVLALGSVITCFAWVEANESKSQIPVIRISGDGEPLYDQEGNKIFHYKDVAKLISGESGTDNPLSDPNSIFKDIGRAFQYRSGYG